MLDKKLGEQGMMLLYAVPWPPQGIYVKKPINLGGRPEGRQVARLQPGHRRIAELVGAQPVTVQAAELSQALATGVIESYMSLGLHRLRQPRPTSTSSTGTTRRPGCRRTRCIVNKAAFDALDAPSKQALLKAGADAEARGWEAREGQERRVHSSCSRRAA